MSGIFARISSKYMLRGWTDCPLALVERQFGERLHRCGEYEYVVRSCNGTCDFSSPAFLPIHRQQLRELIESGLAVFCERGEGLDREQEFRFTPCPILKEINWAITDACNLRCVHCFMKSPGRGESVSQNTVERLIAEIIRANVPFVTLTGGEPLLSPHFQRIVSELSHAGVRITHISTNGVLLTDDVLDFLLHCGQRPDLLISFDGTSAHDLIRGQRGLESLVLEKTVRVKDKGFSVVMVTTLMKQNINSLVSTYALLRTISPAGWFINRAQSSGLYSHEKRLTTREAAEAILPVYRQWLEDGKPFPLVAEKFIGGKNFGAVTAESPECAGTSCGAFLLPNGTLVPCQGFVGTDIQKDMPNILETGLMEAWSSPAMVPFRHAVKKERLSKNPRCASCEHFNECGMGCRAYALTEAGSMNAPDPDFCDFFTQGWKEAFDE